MVHIKVTNTRDRFYTKEEKATKVNKFIELDRELFTSVQNNYSSVISSKLAGRKKISTQNIYCFIPIYETLDEAYGSNIKSYRKLQNAFLPTSQIVLSTSKEDYNFTSISNNRAFTAELRQNLFHTHSTYPIQVRRELCLPVLTSGSICTIFKSEKGKSTASYNVGLKVIYIRFTRPTTP